MRSAQRRELSALVVTALVIAIASIYYAKALSHLDHRAESNSALSFSDREIAGGNSAVIDQEAAYEAIALIPSSDTYRVVTGERLRNATPLTLSFVDGWFKYFLMPRRPAADAHWTICYGCDLSALVPPGRVRWRDANRISIINSP
jgi:hypothetical protein